jgi:hypothetical protein
VALKYGPSVTYESCTAFEFAEDPSGDKKIKYAEEFIDANAFSHGFSRFWQQRFDRLVLRIFNGSETVCYVYNNGQREFSAGI